MWGEGRKTEGVRGQGGGGNGRCGEKGEMEGVGRREKD